MFYSTSTANRTTTARLSSLNCVVHYTHPWFLLLLLIIVSQVHLLAQSGSIDASFGIGGKVVTGFGRSESYANAVAVQPDGKILCAGTTYTANTTREYQRDSYNALLIRYNPDGSRDRSFGDNGVVINKVEATGNSDGIYTGIYFIKVLSDGRILTYGYQGTNIQYGGLLLTMYNPDGSVDISFGNNGFVFSVISPNSSGTPLVIQSDNKIVVLGGLYFSSTDATQNSATFFLERYNADGSLDSMFGTTGQVLTTFGALLNNPGSLAIQADGKIIASGSRNGPLIFARYNTNGSLDNTFDGDGRVITTFGTGNNSAYVDVLPNGKIQSAGTTGTSAGTHFAITQYNTNGSLDLTFDSDGRTLALFDVNDNSDRITSVSKQPDGKFLVTTIKQPLSEFDNPDDFVIRRYNTDGTVDNAFGTNGKVATALGLGSISKNTATQTDGKIILVGNSKHLLGPVSAVVDFNVLRYNSNGILDTSFNEDGIISEKIESSNDNGRIVLKQDDGKLLLIGVQKYNALNTIGNSEIAMARYNQDGSLDNSFGLNGKNTFVFGENVNNVRKAALQPDGKILVMNEYLVWSDQTNGQEVIRFNSDGTLDAFFGTNGKISISASSTFSALSAIYVNEDGSFLVLTHGVNPTGNPDNYYLTVRRFNSNGGLNTGFGNAGTVYIEGVFYNGADPEIEVQTDGKIIISAFLQGSTGLPGIGLFRLNSDGSVDESFQNETLAVDIQSSPFEVFIETDGKIIVAGVSIAVNEFYVFNNFISARYNADGSLDTSYGTNGVLSTFLGDQTGSLYSIVNSVYRQSDGKLLVGLTRYDQNPGATQFEFYDFAVYRFNAEGEYDESFGETGKVFTSFFNKYDELFSIVLQDDNKIVLAGTTDNGVTRDFALVRLENCINLSEEVSATLCAGESYLLDDTAYTESGIYSATLTSVNGCDSVVTVNLNILNALGSEQEITLCEGETFTINGETYAESGIYQTTFQDVSSCDSTVTTFLVVNEVQGEIANSGQQLEAVNYPASATFQWLDCENELTAIANETNPVFTPSASGTYAVLVTNGLCSTTSSCENVVVSSLAQLTRSAESSVVVFPNPFDRDVELRLSGFSWPSKYSVLNTTGQVMCTGSITQERIRLPLNFLAVGLYKILVEDEQGHQITTNMVKE